MNITTVKQARQLLTSKGFYVKGFRWYDMERKCTGQGYNVYNFRGGSCYTGGLKRHGKAEFIQWVNLNF
jgi:hypothetical protein